MLKLSEYHKELALMKVLGYTREDMLADERIKPHLGSISAIDRVLQDDLFKDYVAKLREKREDAVFAELAESEEIIHEAMPKAARLLVEKMENARGDAMQLKAILGVLHIGGLKPKVKEEEKPHKIPKLSVTEVHHYHGEKEAG